MPYDTKHPNDAMRTLEVELDRRDTAFIEELEQRGEAAVRDALKNDEWMNDWERPVIEAWLWRKEDARTKAIEQSAAATVTAADAAVRSANAAEKSALIAGIALAVAIFALFISVIVAVVTFLTKTP